MFTKKSTRIIAIVAFVFVLLAGNASIKSALAYVDPYHLTTPTVSTNGSNVSFTSTFTPASNQQLDSLGFEYATQSNFSDPVALSSTSSGALTTQTFSASTVLSSDTQYYVRSYAWVTPSDSIPFRIESDVQSFTTDNIDNNYIDVETVGAEFDNNTITAVGQINNNYSSVYEKGFVYSQTASTPTLNDSYIVANGSNDTEVFDANFPANNGSYYVRAYAKTYDHSPSYGSVVTVNNNASGVPDIDTETVRLISSTEAEVDINVLSEGSSTISERGVVFSKSSAMPRLGDSTSKHVTTSGTTGRASVRLNNLDENTRYYARGYATNSYGTGYGDILSFTTNTNGSTGYWYNGTWYAGNNNYDYGIDTVSITNITANSATANANIATTDGNAITERGFCYSSSNSTPTVADQRKYDTGNTLGSYSLPLTDLAKNTMYYVRSYYKTSTKTYYGDTITFTTASSGVTGGDYSINIVYRTTSGTSISTQTIHSAYDKTLTASDLTVPSGYQLHTPNWTYVVKGSADVAVVLDPINMGEVAFMPVYSGYLFKPDTAITRAEVAQIIYNLSDKKITGTPKSFSDVENSTFSEAIQYVSAQGLMVGYPNGTFQPNTTITRAEMSVVMCTVYKLTGASNSSFTDLAPSYWAYNYISLATNAGMISGYPDGTFQPNNSITRAEVCILFSTAENRSLNPLGTAQFADVPSTHWAYDYIMNAAIPLA